MRTAGMIAATVALGAAWAAGAAPGGSELLVDLDANGLVPGPLTAWANRGIAGGAFRSGFSGGAVAGTVAGRAAVSFDGKRSHLSSSFAAAAAITGRAAFTVAAWAFNPQVATEECLVQWARRGTTSRTAQLNYGTSKDFGAVTHWGGADMGYDGGVPRAGEWHHIAVTYTGGPDGVETVYVDGRPNATEIKTLDLWPGCPVRLGAADGEKLFSGALAGVQVYDSALTKEELAQLAGAEGRAPARKPLVDLDARGLPPGPLARWDNRGTLGGHFGLEPSSPAVARVGGRTAVTFEQNRWLKSDFSAPAAITGTGAFTVEVWAYNPAVSDGRETMLSWAPSGQPGEVHFGYGESVRGGAFSAGRAETAYRGGPAPGKWHHVAYAYTGGDGGMLTVYVDGEVNVAKALRLDTKGGEPICLGGAWDPVRGVASSPFSGSLARLRIHARALSQPEVRNSMGLYAAFGPSPADGQQLDALEATLRWTPGAPATRSFDLYFGEERGEVEKAERPRRATAPATGPAAPEGGAFRGNQPADRTSYGPVKLALGRTYHWRVDQLDEAGVVRQPGGLWHFTADTGKAAGPAPRDRLAAIPVATESLAWTPGKYAVAQKVYVGQRRRDVEAAPAPAIAELPGSARGCKLPAGALRPGTTYYWRVDQLNGDLPASRGDVWAFRTADAPVAGDVTFFVATDTHYGASETIGAANRATIDFMNFLPGTAYPATLGDRAVRTPRGVVLCGDLTHDGRAEQWAEFVEDYGVNCEGRLNYPVYENWGNHDGNLSSPVREGVRQRTKRRAGLAAVSGNGLHYSWDWDHVHLICLNVYAGVEDDPNGHFRNRPEHSLEFLREDLARHVGDSGRPVVIFQHFGWDGFSLGWEWWTELERRAMYEAIRNYNVVGIFHGHSHAASATTWQGIPIYNVGAAQRDPKGGECFVVRITRDEITVAHRFTDRWGPAVRRPLRPPGPAKTTQPARQAAQSERRGALVWWFS